MGEKEMNAERLAKLEAKMDLLLESFNTMSKSLNTQYVRQIEFDDLKRRVDKLENAPSRWIPIIIAGASLLFALLKG